MFNKFKSKSKSDPRSVGNRASPLLVDTYDVATHRGTTSSSSGIFNSNTKGGSSKKRSSGILDSRSSKSNSIRRRSDGVSSSSSNEEEQQQRRRKGSDYVIMFLPIIASAFTLALLLVLLQYDKKQQQEYHQGQYQQNQNQNDDDDGDNNQNENNDDGNNNNNNNNIATEYLNGYYYTIQEKAISDILSIYEPYWIILVLATVSALLTSIVTLSRNVQVYVYQQRRTHARLSSVAPTTTMTTFTSTTSLATGTALGASWCSKGINVLATIVNIVSYLGLLVAVVVPSDSPQRTAQILHSVGALVFFTGTALYAVLHCVLLWLVQGDLYNVLVKLLFTILSVIIVTSSLIFGYSLIEDSFMMDTNNNEDDNNNKDDDADDTGINYFQVLPAVAFEWIAVITTAIHTGCFLLLFYIDPVDDEIDDFLMTFMSSLSCCCCGGGGGGGGGGSKNTTTNTNKRITRQQQKRQQQHGRSASTRNRGEMF